MSEEYHNKIYLSDVPKTHGIEIEIMAHETSQNQECKQICKKVYNLLLNQKSLFIC